VIEDVIRGRGGGRGGARGGARGNNSMLKGVIGSGSDIGGMKIAEEAKYGEERGEEIDG